MSLTLPKKIKISPQTLFQKLDDQAVILGLETESYYALDDVAARMWQVIDESDGDVGTTVQKLMTEYDVNNETLCKDMADWIGKLVELKLVEIIDDES